METRRKLRPVPAADVPVRTDDDVSEGTDDESPSSALGLAHGNGSRVLSGGVGDWTAGIWWMSHTHTHAHTYPW